MNIGNRISELRKKAALTQEDLAEKLHVSRQSVTKWERNESNPEIERLVELSILFNVTIDFLIKGRNEYSTYDDEVLSDFDEIKAFLCEAKKNTYAAHGAEIKSSRLHSHDLCFKDEKFLYLDSYFGGEQFSGEEILYVDNKPFWSMNYMGRVLGNDFSGDFLKQCLLSVNKEQPYRGPEIYKNGMFTYHCSVKGAFDWFTGDEVMYFQSEKVYECILHGGIIK